MGQGFMNRGFVLPISLIFGAAILLMAITTYLPLVTAVEIDVYPGNSIQEVINNPNITMGDVIIVHEGIYYENITFLGKAITVRSIDPNNFDMVANTIIDGNQAGIVVTFSDGEGSDSLLSGLKVRNGHDNFGGGIYCNSSSPTIAKCIITENFSNWGAGICCEYSSSPLIANCTITKNSSDNGGGVYYFNSSLSRLIDCTIIDNSGSWGAGICCEHSSPIISNCIIAENTSSVDGGGIYCYASSPSITNCSITGNSVDEFGGGICCDSSSITLSNCLISNNSASEDGGGIYCDSSSPSITNCSITGNSGAWGGGICCDYLSSPSIKNCNIIDNSADCGAGIECYDFSSPTIVNCLISGNEASEDGGGIYCDSSSPNIINCIITKNSADCGGGISCYEFSFPTISNSILWGDTPDEMHIFDSASTITHSNIQNGYINGTGIIDVNPLFVDPNAGDYHLKSDSPCIDKGDPNIPNLPSTDRDGNPRIINNKPDIGAYEYFEELLTLCYGLNFVTFPQGLEWNSLMDQNIPFLKIQTYQSETSTWLTLGPSYDGNFSFSFGRGWLVYINQQKPGCIYYSFPEAEDSPLIFNPFTDLFSGMNLLNFYSLSKIINNDKDPPVIRPENFFQKVSQETGKESTSVVRYDPLKGKWQADYQFFDRPAGLRSELKKEGYALYLQ